MYLRMITLQVYTALLEDSNCSDRTWGEFYCSFGEKADNNNNKNTTHPRKPLVLRSIRNENLDWDSNCLSLVFKSDALTATP